MVEEVCTETARQGSRALGMRWGEVRVKEYEGGGAAVGKRLSRSSSRSLKREGKAAWRRKRIG